jgi:hypothetical protein
MCPVIFFDAPRVKIRQDAVNIEFVVKLVRVQTFTEIGPKFDSSYVDAVNQSGVCFLSKPVNRKFHDR